MTPPPLLLLASGLYSHGGVQAYTRRLSEILSAYGQLHSRDLYCLSLQDGERRDMHSNPVTYARFQGAGGSKLRFACASAVAAATRRASVTVVSHPGIVPLPWLLRIRPFVLVLHGIEAWRRLAVFDRRAAARAEWIVATTHYTAQVFSERNGIPLSRTCVIPLAVPERCTAPVEAETADPSLRVLAIARMTQKDAPKGIDTLIDAVSQARSSGANVTLQVIGGGDDRARLERQAAALGLNGNVRFLGSVPDSRVSEELGRCDVFALPSRKEGFGISYLEAMRCGHPCIGGRHGGVPEVIDDGVDGYLVDHGDTSQLCDRLLRLFRNPDLRRQMGQRARQKVESRYLFPHMRDRWFELLDRTVR